MKKLVNVDIPASDAKKYPIIIGHGVLDTAGILIKEYTKAKKLLIVTNETVFPLYGERLADSLRKAGLAHEFVVMKDGERYKTVESFYSIISKAIDIKLERKDVFVALGGGVVGDLTGYAAASYLRGVDFVQIPTTLLAQVDSSVGGKVGINHEMGKNLIGAFYQPKFVLADTGVLTTLPVGQLKVGLAEILKYAFIEKSCGYSGKALGLIAYLEQNIEKIFALNIEIMPELIAYCCELKASVVNQDEKEAGLRAILNFGHTIGHAVEKMTNYEVFNHGQAVAIGMKGAFDIAFSLKLIDEEYYHSSNALIDLYGMDYKIPTGVLRENLMQAMTRDKKVQDGKVRFVLSEAQGTVGIYDFVESEVLAKAVEGLY